MKVNCINNWHNLVYKNKAMVYKIVKKYKSVLPHEDLISFGNIGLCKAAKLFDPSRGFKFSTFAYKIINQEISTGIAEECYGVTRSHIADSHYKKPELLEPLKTVSLPEYFEKMYPTEHTIEELDAKIDFNRLRTILKSLLPRLTRRQQEIITQRWGLNSSKEIKTQTETAKILGLKQNGIWSNEQNVYRKWLSNERLKRTLESFVK